jgi:hypothetical protein
MNSSETELQPVGSIDPEFKSNHPEAVDRVMAETDGNLERQPAGVVMDDFEVSVQKLDVHDDHQEANEITPPQKQPGSRGKLDYIVIAIVISAAIVFGVFQIRECVAAHTSPSSQSRSQERSRLFPGLMICPYTTPEMKISPPDYCPDWKDDASLSFNYGGYFPRAFNTNVNFRESGRLQSVCPKNIKKSEPSLTSTGVSFSLAFGKIAVWTDSQPDLNKNDEPFAVETIVKNLPDPDSISKSTSCLTWTPPNVKCLLYDPFEFDKMAKKYGLDPKCNPMRETVPNSFDSFQLAFNIPDIDNLANPPRAPEQGFQYQGLLPPIDPKSSYYVGKERDLGGFKQPFSQFASVYDLQKQLESNVDWFGWNSTFFGGLMIVLYDPTEGVPKKLDFNMAPLIMNNQEGSFATSQIFFSKNFKYSQAGAKFEFTKPIGPIVAAVDSAFQKTFTSAILNEMQETVKYFFSFAYSVDKKSLYDDKYFDISLQFVSSVSTLTEEVVKISVLTTISIILSTIATLWGSRENISEGLLLVWSKARVTFRGSFCHKHFGKNLDITFLKDDKILELPLIKDGQ